MFIAWESLKWAKVNTALLSCETIDVAQQQHKYPHDMVGECDNDEWFDDAFYQHLAHNMFWSRVTGGVKASWYLSDKKEGLKQLRSE